MRGDFRRRLNEPVGERRPVRPPRPWIVPLATGVSILVLAAALIVILATGQQLF